MSHPHLEVNVPGSPTVGPRTVVAGQRPPSPSFPSGASGPRSAAQAKVNPFTYTTPLSRAGWYEYVKLGLNTVLLVPFRVVVVAVSVLLMWVVASVSLIGWAPPSHMVPLPWWRRMLQTPLPYLARAVLFGFGYIWITERGAPAPRERAPIVVAASHTGLMEGLYMYWKIAPAVVSVSDNARAPILGTLLRASQTLFVDRSVPSSRHDVLEDIRTRALDRDAWPVQTLIFPEGVCTARTALVTFKRGAFVPGVPIQPVAMSWPHTHFSVATLSLGPSVGAVLWRTMAQFVNHMEVTWMEVWEPNFEERADPAMWAKAVRAAIAHELNLPVSDHTYEDLKLLLEARRAALPDDAALLEFDAIQSLHQVSFSEAAELLHKFIALDVDRSGTVTIDEFASALGMPVNEHVEHLFDVLDRTQTGSLDFRSFTLGILFLSDAVSNEEVLRFGFDLLDTNKDGTIDRAEFERIMSLGFPELSKDTCAKIYSDADTGGAGALDFDSFHAYVQSHPDYFYMLMDAAMKPNSPLNSGEPSAQ